MQLVAYGAQDIYLTGNPQITFFKVVYRRHTNFSMETIRQTFNGSGTSVNATISRNGDLVHKLYVTSAATTTNGSSFVSEAELEIGGQRIDRHFQEWNEIWNELSTDESKAIGLKSMIGCIGTVGDGTGVGKIHLPLNFWFCRNPGLALPLIALQYHEVKVKLTLAGGGTGNNTDLWADYIYLDTDERRRFAQVSHEYLIEQVQRQNLTDTTTNKLNFNHPVKELIWTSTANYDRAHIKLNGHDRFALQEPEYFQLRQPYDYHTAVPAQNLPSAGFASARPIGYTRNLVATGAAGTSLGGATPGAAAISTGTLEVGVANGDTLIAGTTFDANTSNPGNPLRDTFFFLDTDIGVVGTPNLVVNDVVLVTVTGTDSVNNTVLTTVRDVQLNTFFDAGVATNVVAVQFDTALIGDGGSGSDAPGEFTIHSITKVADAGCRTSQMVDNINVYSFALKPEEHQPSGTCNFSRIDNAQLVCEGNPTFGNMYAVNYNVLRIMSGMGGLAYSN